MSFTVIPNEIPIVFLDTSIFINLAKEENFELYNQLQTKVDNEEIIIFACNQELEFIRGDINKDFLPLKIFFKLTSGYCINKDIVEKIELSIYAKEIFTQFETQTNINDIVDTKISNLIDKTFLIDSKYVLSRDVKKIMEDSLWNQMMNSNPKEEKKELFVKLENIAKKEGTFEKFMITELSAERIKVKNEISKYEFIPDFTDDKVLSNISDEFTRTILKKAKYYILSFANPKSYEEYLRCLAEFYAYYLVYTPPHKFIFARVFGYLFFTGKIASGDYRDIEYLSYYLPYCDYYFTDKKMCNVVKELKLDQAFNTEVLRLKDLKKLLII
ncbi:hypothetical protein R2F61_01110 [Mollicutes bacterium LVI A0078]|nr:hypothetical protein R2F61_01110 [Mollicutes bacterium LVI A0078]